jgi:hypothetical protein
MKKLILSLAIVVITVLSTSATMVMHCHAYKYGKGSIDSTISITVNKVTSFMLAADAYCSQPGPLDGVYRTISDVQLIFSDGTRPDAAHLQSKSVGRLEEHTKPYTSSKQVSSVNLLIDVYIPSGAVGYGDASLFW